MVNHKKIGRIERDAWMYTASEVDYIEQHLKVSGGKLWVPDGDDGDIVKRSLAVALSHAVLFVKLFDVTALTAKAPEPPLIFVAFDSPAPDAYVTSPADGRPLIRVDMELARGFSDLIKMSMEGGNLGQDAVGRRYVFMLTWGLRWLLFHEIAHLGFGHFNEKKKYVVRPEVGLSVVAEASPPRAAILELRCQEAEADLWATHMTLRDVASQFYQILIEPGTPHGRPFSDHIFFSLITLFSYLNKEALAHNAYAKRVHPHPLVRATLVHWYAMRICSPIEFFVVDWQHVRRQLDMTAMIFQYNKLPNLMLSGQDNASNVQDDINLTLVRLRERQTTRISGQRRFRLDL
jgi:hypothetical protein